MKSSAASLLLLCGCAHVEDQFREDGPSVDADWNSPTAADVYARFQPAEARMRSWDATPTQSESGAVTHGPLYFEDPFEDKGRAAVFLPGQYMYTTTRVDNRRYGICASKEGITELEHKIGWEDVFATPYGYSRNTLNWLGLPVSMIVTPPWTEMISDGVLSEQALGYDHDATPTAGKSEPRVPPAASEQSSPQATPANGTPASGNSDSVASPKMNGLQVIRP